MSPTEFDQWLLDPRRRVLVMAVLNVTPDSFSDGGRFASPSAAAEQARAMIDQGADLIDVGGESTRPGAQRVMPAEQIARVVPAINAIRRVSDITISIDTTSSSVAEAALQAGANIVNDISAGREDPRIFPLVAQRRVPIILMHMQGSPATMQQGVHRQDHGGARPAAAQLRHRRFRCLERRPRRRDGARARRGANGASRQDDPVDNGSRRRIALRCVVRAGGKICCFTCGLVVALAHKRYICNHASGSVL